MRERERERERNNLSVMKNYTKNGRENNKFIEDGVNMKRQNKRKWMERWIVILRLRVVGRWKGKGGKDEKTKLRKMKSDIKVEGSGEMKR